MNIETVNVNELLEELKMGESEFNEKYMNRLKELGKLKIPFYDKEVFESLGLGEEQKELYNKKCSEFVKKNKKSLKFLGKSYFRLKNPEERFENICGMLDDMTKAKKNDYLT